MRRAIRGGAYGTRANVSGARVIREGGKKKWHLECMNAVHPFSHVHPTPSAYSTIHYSLLLYASLVSFSSAHDPAPTLKSSQVVLALIISCLQKIYGACVNERKTIAKGRGTLYFCD